MESVGSEGVRMDLRSLMHTGSIVVSHSGGTLEVASVVGSGRVGPKVHLSTVDGDESERSGVPRGETGRHSPSRPCFPDGLWVGICQVLRRPSRPCKVTVVERGEPLVSYGNRKIVTEVVYKCLRLSGKVCPVYTRFSRERVLCPLCAQDP